MPLVTYEKQGAIAIITLNRPEKLNAMNAQLLADLRGGYEEFERDEQVFVAVITGSGRAFCAGRDIKEQAQTGGGLEAAATTQNVDLYMTNALSKPMIAAVNGFAGGSGYLLATRFVDLTVAAEAAIFEITEVRLGQMYGWESGREFGLTRTASMELAFGFPLSGRRAFEVGLVNDVTANDRLMAVAMARAEHIARMPQRIIRYHRELLRMMIPPIPEDVQRRFTQYYAAAQSSADFVEGDRAFIEKRKTQFSS